jgi:Protein of unknown function (DUF1194)
MKGLGVLALAVGLAASAPPTAAQEIPVDLELVLAVDVSGSVDEREYSLQMIGISEALRLPEVGELIASHHDGVALTLVHWSAAHVNRQVVPWRLLRNGADASAFADEVDKSHRSNWANQTAIGHAIQFCVKLLETNAYAGSLRRIDMSGDGRNNSGIAPATARETALARHITVNGLPILDGDYGLGDYYSAFVAGGDDAFVITAETYKDFAKAFRTKLIRELSPKLALRPRQLGSRQLGSWAVGSRQ